MLVLGFGIGIWGLRQNGLYRDYRGLHRVYIGIMEEKMETTIIALLGFGSWISVKGLGSRAKG